MTQATSIDLLLSASWIIPVEPFGKIIENAAIAIDDGKILGIFQAEEAKKQFCAKTYEHLEGQVLIPGLINGHTHAAMTLLRGYADDMALMPWLTEKIWPTESRLLNEQSVYDGALLACKEMLMGGITCFNDMYFYPESTIKAVLHSGIRGMIGLIVFDEPSVHTQNADDCLSQAEGLLETWQGSNDRLYFCMAPHAPYTVSDDAFAKIKLFKEKHGLKMTIHLNETEGEVEQSLESYGKRPVDRLESLGLMDPDLIAVHSVSLSETDIQKLKKAGASVIHCPVSNLKLASGIAPVPQLLAHDITVGLGTDGTSSNNRLDIIEEMRLAALLAKVKSMDPTSLTAFEALSMATIDGARALGLDDQIGSLKKGKFADICAIDVSKFEYQPCYNVISHLVYVCGRESVTNVWVGGKKCYSVGKLQQTNDKSLDKSIAMWQNFVLR